MDDLKLFAKSNNQIDSLVGTVYPFSEDIGMEFGIKKCGVLVLKRGKVDKAKSKGLNLPNGKLMKTIDEERYKYLGILEYDKVKEKEMKTEFVREYKRRLRLISRSKLNRKNKIKAINSWAVAIMGYDAGVLEWRFDELKELDRKTRKLLTMHKELHSKCYVDRLHVSRKEEGRGLVSCESTIRSEENNLGWYLMNANENLLQGVKHVRILKFKESVSKKDFKKSLNEKRIDKWKEKQMYGQFIRDMPEGEDKEKSWIWLRKCDLKIPSEILICFAQKQAMRTNYVKCHIDKSVDSLSCSMCSETCETISYIVSQLSKLDPREYKRMHDNVARMIHWKLCLKFNLEKS